MLFSIIGPQTPIVAAVSPNPPSGGIHTVAPQNGGQLHGTGQPAPPAAGPVGVSGGGAPPQKKGKPGEGWYKISYFSLGLLNFQTLVKTLNLKNFVNG